MKIRDAYKLKWFGTYIIEIDCDEQEKIQKFAELLRKHLRWRFIRFILVPKDLISLTLIKQKGNRERK